MSSGHAGRIGCAAALALLLAGGIRARGEDATTPAVDVTAFGAVPVLENGRKMPMDSFARIKLLQFSGKSTLQRAPALDWLCRTFFTPEAARDERIFVINHPQVVQSLGVEPEPRRRYSLAQLEPAMRTLQQSARAASAMDSDARTIVEEEFMRVAHNVNTYLALWNQFAVTMPDVPAHSHGRPVPIAPVRINGEESWVGPADLARRQATDPGAAALLDDLRAIADTYRAGDQAAFDTAVAAYVDHVIQQAEPDRQVAHLGQELLYNRLDLLYRSEVLYGLAFLFGFAVVTSGSRRVRWVGLLLLGLGLLAHTVAIGMRMDIMGRPPVTNLYSTFVFVAWSAVLLCAVMEVVQKHGLGLLGGGLSGLALLLLSRRYMSMSDPMGVLVAVLDSNFWLATHVVTISLGYAGCVLAGVIGHFYLLQAIIGPGNRERLRSLYVSLFAMLGFGFTFSFLGTMLGGVWADQSWGRFWGWDPKENGALLIVLWCAILFHARAAGMIRNIGMAAGSIIGVIVVLFAWIGVNLLNVGLHSYGFTSGVAGGLFGYTVIQLLVLAGLTVAARLRLKRTGAVEQEAPEGR